MSKNQLHKEIEDNLIHYHLYTYSFNPIDTEFNFFKVLDSRKFLESHQNQMNKAELLMLTLTDKMAIKEYQDLKNGSCNQWGTVKELLQEENVQDLQKVVLLAMKNLKNNQLLETATKIQNLDNSDLIFNSCVVETL